MTIDANQITDWAIRAGQDLRELIRQLDYIILGRPSWLDELSGSDNNE